MLAEHTKHQVKVFFSFQKCTYIYFLVFITAVCFLFLLEHINKLKSLRHSYSRENNSHRPLANIYRNIYFCCWLFLLPGLWINTTNSYLLRVGSYYTVEVTDHEVSVNWPWPVTTADNKVSFNKILVAFRRIEQHDTLRCNFFWPC